MHTCLTCRSNCQFQAPSASTTMIVSNDVQVKCKIRACQVQRNIVFHIGHETRNCQSTQPYKLNSCCRQRKITGQCASLITATLPATNEPCLHVRLQREHLANSMSNPPSMIMSTVHSHGGLFRNNHIPMQGMKTKALPQLRNCSNAQN